MDALLLCVSLVELTLSCNRIIPHILVVVYTIHVEYCVFVVTAESSVATRAKFCFVTLRCNRDSMATLRGTVGGGGGTKPKLHSTVVMTTSTTAVDVDVAAAAAVATVVTRGNRPSSLRSACTWLGNSGSGNSGSSVSRMKLVGWTIAGGMLLLWIGQSFSWQTRFLQKQQNVEDDGLIASRSRLTTRKNRNASKRTRLPVSQTLREQRHSAQSRHRLEPKNQRIPVVPVVVPSKDTASSLSPVIHGVSKSSLQAILEARVHLVELVAVRSELVRGVGTGRGVGTTATDYTGIYATFCRLDWSLHQGDPSTYPMFRDLVQASRDCRESHRISHVPLHDMVALAKSYDATHHDTVRVLNFTAAVFHESRCGSTLTANLLSAVNPTKHRVYSESTPPIQALHQICGEDYSFCSLETAATLLQDVIYLMSRTDNVHQERVFFKIQSAGSRNLPVFLKAFPKTPYLFVYRDPVQVIMSHLKFGTKQANCLRSRKRPPPSVEQVVAKYDASSVAVSSASAGKAVGSARNQPRQRTTAGTKSQARQLEPEHYCAAHLASITETVVEYLTSMGRPINYKNLPEAYYEDIFPRLLGKPLSTSQLTDMKRVAALYSKHRGGTSRGSVAKDGLTFASDSAQKERQASDAVRRAAQIYLTPSYQKLEALAAARAKR
jgi:hypothetical protein